MIIGLVVTRLLLQGGEWLFSVYTLITVGMGVSVMLTELIRLGSVPILGASLCEGEVLDSRKFSEDLSATFAISLAGSVLGAAIMLCLGWLLLGTDATLSNERAVWLFLFTRIAMMVFAVALTPAMVVLLVSGRQPTFNLFLFLERVAELIGVAVPLWVLSSSNSLESDHLIQIGAGVALCSIAVYVAAGVCAFQPSSAVKTQLSRLKMSALTVLLQRIGWSSLQILSSNLYVRVDILIVAAFVGPAGTVALGIAIRLMGYVRQATNGLISGLDAIIANLDGQRKRSHGDPTSSDEIEFKLLSLSTCLQGGIVFQLAVLLILLREAIVNLWVGDLIRENVASSTVEDIALLATLMVIGIGFRSLNLSWMSAMTGRGNAKHFSPWLMPGAIGNATVLTVWGTFSPDTFSFLAIGWVFVSFQLMTHGILIPIVSARSLGYPLKLLIEPLFVPLMIAVATFLVAQGLKSQFKDIPSVWVVLGVVVVVGIGFAVTLCFTIRMGGRRNVVGPRDQT
ncbi:hypothetical protein GLP43_16030 [Sulfitobacter sp. M39]|nr:hypothetical protein [Sulfitobacter sp. M39]